MKVSFLKERNQGIFFTFSFIIFLVLLSYLKEIFETEEGNALLISQSIEHIRFKFVPKLTFDIYDKTDEINNCFYLTEIEQLNCLQKIKTIQDDFLCTSTIFLDTNSRLETNSRLDAMKEIYTWKPPNKIICNIYSIEYKVLHIISLIIFGFCSFFSFILLIAIHFDKKKNKFK